MPLATEKFTETETAANQAKKLNELLAYIEALEARLAAVETP